MSSPSPKRDGSWRGLSSALASAGSWLVESVGTSLAGSSGSTAAAIAAKAPLPSALWGIVERFFEDVEIKHGKEEMQKYCFEQLFGLRNGIIHKFDLFTQANYQILHELELLKCKPHLLNLNSISHSLSPQIIFPMVYR